MISYRIEISPLAREMLFEISDRRIREKIAETINRLQVSPELQGKALLGPLSGYRSIRAVGQRYRIIYKIENHQIRVIVIAPGIRKDGDKKDVYRRLQRLIHLKLIQ